MPEILETSAGEKSRQESGRSVLLQSLKTLIKKPTYAHVWLRRADFRLFYYLARGESFTEANARRMDARARSDPTEAIGGFNRGIGKLQLAFLKSEGMEPSDTLLDIGCGSLRGGRYTIPYLEPGNYTGLDISAEALQAGKEELGDETLSEKNPELLVNSDLKFQEREPNSADYALAQSVFTHIPPEDIRECFAHIGRVLSSDGAFYPTFYESEGRVSRSLIPELASVLTHLVNRSCGRGRFER